MDPVNTATITFSTSPPVYPFSLIIFEPNHTAKAYELNTTPITKPRPIPAAEPSWTPDV